MVCGVQTVFVAVLDTCQQKVTCRVGMRWRCALVKALGDAKLRVSVATVFWGVTVFCSIRNSSLLACWFWERAGYNKGEEIEDQVIGELHYSFGYKGDFSAWINMFMLKKMRKVGELT
jgi:hypothetical protein